MPPPQWKPILLGALAVGALDLLDAFIFFGLRGASPIRILQSIASGLLGKAAFSGGVPAAALGVMLHFFIAAGIVTTLVLASRRLPELVQRPLVFGPLYGIAVYAVMNLVVVPLSAAASGPQVPVVVLNGVLIHMLGVGIPAALAARAAAGRFADLRDGAVHPG